MSTRQTTCHTLIQGCYNINECEVGRTDCDPNAQCVDIVGEKGISGLYRCECNPGYHGSGETCFDDDECSLGTHTCDLTKSYCVNVEMPNRFLCECKTGYLSDTSSTATSGIGFIHGPNCIDFDECVEDQHNCDNFHGECINRLVS